jgi:hypothetical protein
MVTPDRRGELLKLGFCGRAVDCGQVHGQHRRPPVWSELGTFLRNHLPQIAAMDLFVVPTRRAMPSHQRLGPDGRHCLHDRWKPPIQLEEEQAIAVRELDPTAHLSLKHDQLMSERSILSLKSADRPERRNQQPQKEEEQHYHRRRRYVIPLPDQTDEVFGTHR